jgi:formate dehydrogenase subunit gamma
MTSTPGSAVPMGATMSPRNAVQRFTRAQRWVHRAVALLMGVCLLTAAMLYFGPFAVAVGRRHLIATIHLYAGLALPVPVLAGLLSGAFRTDLRLLNRFDAADWEWIRRKDRRQGRVPIGKFNPGQKVNAAFVGGAILVMVGTGVVLGWPNPWPLQYRQGATFVHDWLAAAIVVMTAGHIVFALRDPEARLGLRTGFVSLDWARREHPSWAARHESPARPPHSQTATPGPDPAGEGTQEIPNNRRERAWPRSAE